MRSRGAAAVAAVGLAGLVFGSCALQFPAFVLTPQATTPPVSKTPSLRATASLAGGATRSSSSGLAAVLGAAFAAAACARGARILMRGGQSGRYNFGQQATSQIKKTKRRHLYRKRKQYGSNDARQIPVRYELYDMLEEYDDTLPYYTVLSQPDVPEEATENVPLSERYPWAGETKWHRQQVKAQKNNRLEPLFGSTVWQNLPPMTRRQKWEARKGHYPTHNYPKWAYEPDWDGLKPNLPGDLAWESDRRVKAEHYTKKQLEKIAAMPKEKTRNMHPSVQAEIAKIRDEDAPDFEVQDAEE